jgi:short-subunit dehydrogenase
MNELFNKVIWITGAGKGIGAATAMKFVDEGATVAATSQHDFSNHIELGHYPHKYIHNTDLNFIVCDVINPKQITETYNSIIKKYGMIDILINNAGVGLFKPFAETTADEFDNIMNVNFKGAFLCTKTVINYMLKRKSGMIINISSSSVIENFANCSIYNASKSALLAMSRSLRNEVREYGIKIVDIIVGPTFTDIWDEKSKNEFKDRMLMPNDIADIIYQTVISNLENRLMVEEIVIRPQKGNI